MFSFEKSFCSLVLFIFLMGCSAEDTVIDFASVYPNFTEQFSETIDMSNLENYEAQEVPSYITRDNTTTNSITNRGATLGRVLFYDKSLSSDNTVSCATCHQQAHAFSDTNDVSTGVNGVTGRHSMRLVNSRFSREGKFFWDERAGSLEVQTTQPIQDHNEMGFSGTNGDQNLEDLIAKMTLIPYYPEGFNFVFGTSEITEERIQNALAQFIRSIQSFDSKYDIGRALVENENDAFSNFTANENAGKQIFLTPPPQGGAGCAGCHSPPEFDIDPNSGNNGVIGVFGEVTSDLTVTRSPSLRDLIGPSGSTNGKFMHDASMETLEEVLNHYNNGIVSNASIDNRLVPGGNPQNLNLNATEIDQLEAFLRTLTGSDMYTNPKWSDPF